jgi:hypothetical protein
MYPGSFLGSPTFDSLQGHDRQSINSLLLVLLTKRKLLGALLGDEPPHRRPTHTGVQAPRLARSLALALAIGRD